jgi:hypothetical protein
MSTLQIALFLHLKKDTIGLLDSLAGFPGDKANIRNNFEILRLKSTFPGGNGNRMIFLERKMVFQARDQPVLMATQVGASGKVPRSSLVESDSRLALAYVLLDTDRGLRFERFRLRVYILI